MTTHLRPHKPVLSLTSASGGIYIAEVKRRNQLLALFCLLVFAAFGVLYFRYWVVQKPFGIILFVGEGLSADRLAALRMYAANPETPLTLDTLSYTALLKNYSNDSAVPDNAAAATAIATGVKVNNGALGVDAEGNALTNLLELARASGRTTGLISDSRLTSAVAAAFYAHTSASEDAHELARTLVDSANIDIVLGGGALEFLPEGDSGTRHDGRDLLAEVDDRGYDLVRSRTELEAVPWWRWPKVFGVFGPGELTGGAEIGPETPQPSLSDMVRRGIELLQIHRGGYLLVVDAGLMRTAAEENDAEGMLAAMLEFDRAISVALRFAGNKATVFVCGDVAIGGLKVNGALPRSDDKSALLPGESAGEAALTWATGPNAAQRNESDSAQGISSAAPAEPFTESTPSEQLPDASGAEANAVPGSATQQLAPTAAEEAAATTREPVPQATRQPAPAAVHAPVALRTAEDVIAFGEGFGAEALHGTIESTVLFEIIRDNL